MKKGCFPVNLILLSLLMIGSIDAQVPQKLSYQAVVRNNLNELVKGTTIGVQISILQSSPTGSAVYAERHTPVTSAAGLITLEIGNGSVVSGSFAGIDWSADTYFLKSEIDLSGGTGYTISGTSQILSVPYALYAEKAGDFDETDPVWAAEKADYFTKTHMQTAGQAELDWGNLTNIDINISDLADGSLTGSKIGTGINASNISSGLLPVIYGGTGATTASEARTNLGLGALATLDAVGSAQITDASVTTLDIANDAITATDIAASAVGSSEIATDAVGSDEIQAGAVGSDEIADNSITTEDVNSIDASEISGITSNYIPRGSGTGMTSGSIFDNGVNLGIGNSWAAQVKFYLNSNEPGISIGMLAYKSGTATNNYAVQGTSLNAGMNNYGIYGTGESSGSSSGYGIYGTALGGGTNYGIYGKASGGSANWAGYFGEGHVHFSNQVEAPALMSASSGATSLVLESGWIRKYSSDKRLKENIVPLAGTLEKVMQLQGVRFSWISDKTSTPDIGFIAQDVEKIFPELVVKDQTDGMLGVKYMNVSAILTEAIKEQQREIEAIKKQNTELAEQIRLLQDRLERLEGR